jgi:hypothetical protein
MKKESQNPVFITSEAVRADSLNIAVVAVNGVPSVRAQLTISYGVIKNNVRPQATFVSTASIRKPL